MFHPNQSNGSHEGKTQHTRATWLSRERSSRKIRNSHDPRAVLTSLHKPAAPALASTPAASQEAASPMRSVETDAGRGQEPGALSDNHRVGSEASPTRCRVRDEVDAMVVGFSTMSRPSLVAREG